MAITERYVTSTGTDTYANSTNPLTPMSLTTAFANAAAGDRINIQAGTYTRSGTDTVSRTGSTTSPIIFRGYSVTPGDLDSQGRSNSSTGAIDTTGFPLLAYNAGTRLNADGSSFCIFQNLRVTAIASNPAVAIGVDCSMFMCSVVNASTNSAAGGISGSSNAGVRVIDCDASSGHGYGIECLANTSLVYGCRATGGLGTAIIGRNFVGKCIAYGSAIGIANNLTSTAATFLDNTVYNCTGDGIEIENGTTVRQTIIGNHITDCGGRIIDFNTSTCVKLMYRNRSRDVTSAINGGGDWGTGTTIAHVTTDNGAAETDYESASGGKFSLVPTAAAFQQGVGANSNIGACAARQPFLIGPGMGGGMNA